MVILRIKLNNILSFYDFETNFSYASKVRTSLIDNEFLTGVPSFRYKKLNVFVGSNASGKTSLIKCIWKTLLFLNLKEKNALVDIINYKYKNSQIEIDLVADENDKKFLHRFKIMTINEEQVDVNVSHTAVKLSTAASTSDSYETKVKELNQLPDNYINYVEALEKINYITGWNMILPATESGFDRIHFAKINNDEEEKEYLDILRTIFKTLDPSIINVSRSQDTDNAIVVEHENTSKIIIQEGNLLSSIQYLSSGTKYAVNISNIIFGIKHHYNGIYLIDEQFSYVNADIEAAILSTMVSMLGNDEQIFFTTHNTNILSLGYPFHSFYFMKKEMKDDKQVIEISCGSEAENRNNVSPKTIIDNDVFATAPEVNKIFELGEQGN